MRQSGSWAVLPVKALSGAKSRLSPSLSPPQRAELARRLMLHSLGALLESEAFESVLVVSRDPEVLALAAGQGAVSLLESGGGLNEALAQGREVALAAGATSLLVLASDLPLVQPEDIRRLLTDNAEAPAVIAPDRRREGTNALLLRPPAFIDFAFGRGSFETHCRLARLSGAEPYVVHSERLGWDVDLPSDLESLELPGSQPLKSCV